MTDVQPVVTDFSSSGRTGRRNALPDIRGSSPGSPGSSELPKKLENLSLSQGKAENIVGCKQIFCLIILDAHFLHDSPVLCT